VSTSADMNDVVTPQVPGSESAAGSEVRPSRSSQEILRSVLAQVSSAEDLRHALDAGEGALIAFDADRTILCANPKGERFFGYGARELDGRCTDVLIPGRLRQPDAPPMAETTDLMQVELPGLTCDGTERAIEWCFGSVRKDGRLVFVMTVRDREAIDRAIESLRDSEHRFQLFVNGVRDCAIYMLDAGGCVSSWNAGAARIKGWNAEEVLGQPYEVFFTPEDRDAGVPAKLLAAAVREGSHRTTGWRVRKDGSRFYVEGSLTVLRDSEGQVGGFAKITRDLSLLMLEDASGVRLCSAGAAREAAEAAERRVRASEERLARLQQVTAALSQAASVEDVAATVLRECADTMGATGGAVYLLAADGKSLEMLGQRGHPNEAAEAHPSLPLDAATPLTDAARERRPAFYESFDECADQYPELRRAIAAGDFQASVALPLVAHGDLLGVLGVRFSARRAFNESERTLLLTFSDVSAQALDRARLFAAESDARAAAESASRAKDEFLAMLGHELRNPLAPISTAIQLMKLKGDDRSQRERDIIERQVLHLNRLVDDLLDVSRLARGLISLSKAPIEVSEILSKAVEMAGPLFEQRNQKLIVSASRPALSIDADAMRIAQVVSNLLTNAAKYTPPGGNVWLSAELEGNEAVIRVRDDGEGIGPDLLPHVFDLFVQGQRSIARSEGGLGLGLALVKSLVALHGGTVSATSQGPGHGSEFTVRVPALAAAPRSVAPPPPAYKIAGRAGTRILVVDDNEDARELLAEMLRTIGYAVELAPDGGTALEKLKTFAADVAILDLGLPGIDGFELARRIFDARMNPRLRLIALTGYGRQTDIARTRAVGFAAHLVKPVNVPALVAEIEGEASSERAPSRAG
jgi:PAS domain S-box-containing protein